MTPYEEHLRGLMELGSNFAPKELTERKPYPVLHTAGDMRELHARTGVSSRVATWPPEWQTVTALGYDRQLFMAITQKDWWPEKTTWLTGRPWEEGRRGRHADEIQMSRDTDKARVLPGALVVSDKSPWIHPSKPLQVIELSVPITLGTREVRYLACRQTFDGEDPDGPSCILLEAVRVNHPARGGVVFKVDTYSSQFPGSTLNNWSLPLALRFAGKRGYQLIPTNVPRVSR